MERKRKMSEKKTVFSKYDSITNSYQRKFLSSLREQIPLEEKWIVHEKLHGTNFSVILGVGTDNISFARRNDILRQDDKFFGYQRMVPILTPKMCTLGELIQKIYPNTEQITVYGELVGGSYPSLASGTMLGMSLRGDFEQIQEHIYYCPHHEYFAFDIKIRSGERDFYLDVGSAHELLKEAEFRVVPELKSNLSLDEALEFDTKFDTVVPSLLGMAFFTPNLCEGIVIRPMRDFTLKNGARAILKKKNLEFMEKMGVKVKPRKEEIRKFPDIINYINENRYNNVYSKFPNDVSIGQLGKALMEDVVEEYLSDHEDLFSVTPKGGAPLNGTGSEIPFSDKKSQLKVLRKEVSTLVFPFVRQKLLV